MGSGRVKGDQMSRTVKVALSGAIALAICVVLLLALLNKAEGSSSSLRERNTIDHYEYTGG